MELITHLEVMKDPGGSEQIPPPTEEISPEFEEFPSLTDNMRDLVNEATISSPRTEVLVSAFKLDITRKDIQTLVGLEWLNDEIINFYMNMLVDRSKKFDGSLPSVYTFNTFFYSTLAKDGYKHVQRWTGQVDLFSHNIILIPVHLSIHWCLAVIDFERREVNYYDSQGGNNEKCLSDLHMYLQEEHKH